MGLVRLGSVAIISVLLAGSAAVLSAAQDSRLADAVRNGDMSSVQTLLKQHVDVNTQQADGMTALLWAAHNDDVAAANLLIRAGASAKTGQPLRHRAADGSSHQRQHRDGRSAA